jgi:hypothetical protein
MSSAAGLLGFLMMLLKSQDIQFAIAEKARTVMGGLANVSPAVISETIVRQLTASTLVENQLTSRMTVLVFEYADLRADILQQAEQETSRIFRRSGIDIVWRQCRPSGTSVPINCPAASPMTPALRLVPRFRPVANRLPSEAIGYTTGDFATISTEFVERLEKTGVARLPKIFGHVMAHEIGHMLLPGDGHSVDGLMTAQWSSVSIT